MVGKHELLNFLWALLYALACLVYNARIQNISVFTLKQKEMESKFRFELCNATSIYQCLPSPSRETAGEIDIVIQTFRGNEKEREHYSAGHQFYGYGICEHMNEHMNDPYIVTVPVAILPLSPLEENKCNFRDFCCGRTATMAVKM